MVFLPAPKPSPFLLDVSHHLKPVLQIYMCKLCRLNSLSTDERVECYAADKTFAPFQSFNIHLVALYYLVQFRMTRKTYIVSKLVDRSRTRPY